MPELPAIVVAGLSDAQKQALRIADNKLALNATSARIPGIRCDISDLHQ